MEKEWDIIEVLRHSRHDWLNKLQLIKGNLDLNRVDRVKAVIDEIVMDAQHETKLSNLQMPQFAALLLKSNWVNPSFQLEYEVFDDNGTHAVDDDLLADWTKSFFSCLNEAVDVFQENHLSITIELEQDGIRFFFDFSGIIKNSELIEKFLTGKDSPIEKQVKEFTGNELAIEVFMPKA